MVISAALRPGCSNSVSQGFEKSGPENTGGALRDALDVTTLVLLHKFDMDLVASRETFQSFAPFPVGLVFEILGLEEYEFAFALKNASAEAVEKIGFAPFALKTLRGFDAMGNNPERDVGQRLDFQDLLQQDLLGIGVHHFQIHPMETVVRLLPNRGDMHGQLGGVVGMSRVVTLHGAIELLDGVFHGVNALLGHAVY